MPYIRVKSADTGHEIDVDPRRVASHPEWTVIDPEPVAQQRPPKHGKPKRKTVTDVRLTETTEPRTHEGAPVDEPEEAPQPANDDRLSKRSAPTGI